MKVLAFNTTTMNASIVLLVGEKRYYQKLETFAKHSESLMTSISQVLEKASIKVSDLDFIAISVGPGSFTGIRLSLAILKAFMTANPNIKAVELNTLELMKRCYNSDENLAFVMNALSGKYFVLTNDEPFLSYDINEISQKKIGLLEEGLLFVDDNVELDDDVMMDIAIEKIVNGEVFDDLNPLYLRNSQAEENLSANRKND